MSSGYVNSSFSSNCDFVRMTMTQQYRKTESNHDMDKLFIFYRIELNRKALSKHKSLKFMFITVEWNPYHNLSIFFRCLNENTASRKYEKCSSFVVGLRFQPA